MDVRTHTKWSFPMKKLYKKYKPNWSSQHEKQCAKIDKVTPECLLKKKTLFCPCSPFSIDNARYLKVGYDITGHILPTFILVAEIFNQLNNPALVWKSASKHHHYVLLLHLTHLYIVAMSDLWHSGLVTSWSPQKRQDKDIPGRGWQQLPGGKSHGLGALLIRGGRKQSPRSGVPSSDPACWLTVGLVFEMVPPGPGSSLQRSPGCAKGMADRGMESPRGFPQPLTSVHGANWGCKTCMEPPDCVTTVWLWAKLYRTCCRHHEAVRPTHPPETAACKYQHCQWQLRLGMDCTCFP